MYGTILRTTDGGQNWISQTSGTDMESINGVSFIDANNGTVVGGSPDGEKEQYYIQPTAVQLSLN